MEELRIQKNRFEIDSTRVAHRSYYHLSNIQHLGELTLAINKAWLTTRGESVDTRYSRDQHQLGSYEQTLNKSLLCIYITRLDSQPTSIHDTDIDHALTPYLWINTESCTHTKYLRAQMMMDFYTTRRSHFGVFRPFLANFLLSVSFTKLRFRRSF